MGLKKYFAKKALAYDDDRRGRDGQAVTVFTLVVTGLAGLMAGGATSEFLPMDDNVKPQSEIAMTEYTAALDALSAAKGEYNTGAPSPLQDLIGSSEAANAHLQKMSGQDLRELSKKFGTALLVDERLNEQQTYDLIAAFEDRIGNFEVFTGYDEPDYADLDESRASIKAQPTLEETAKAIVESSSQDIHHGEFMLYGIGTTLALTFLMMTGISAGRRRLESWAAEKPYKKQQHFNH